MVHTVRMVTSTQRRRLGAVSALLMGAALASLTGCGEQQNDTTAATPESPPSSSPSSSPSPGASPYVEPGVIDGAPHNGENNAYRRPGDMSPAGEEAAKAEAARIEPVLKQLHAKKKWDPQSVRSALTGELGYEVVKTDSKGKVLSGNLTVRAMYARYENDDYVTPEGTLIGLHVGDAACVTASVQPASYGTNTNGPFMETGCITPPTGH